MSIRSTLSNLLDSKTELTIEDELDIGCTPPIIRPKGTNIIKDPIVIPNRTNVRKAEAVMKIYRLPYYLEHSNGTFMYVIETQADRDSEEFESLVRSALVRVGVEFHSVLSTTSERGKVLVHLA